MQVNTRQFKQNARHALHDGELRKAMANARGGFVDKRGAAVEQLPEFQALRDIAKSLKKHTLAHLDEYLEIYENQVRLRGGQVHWARDAQEACAVIVKLCRDNGVKTIAKGKSMVTEEIGLNPILEDAGITPVETDLGEYIIQLAGESPSHIIAPAVHKNREQITELFHRHHAKLGFTREVVDREAIVNEARTVLRRTFMSADAGLTGANFLVAENGTHVLVTNEGNGDLSSLWPNLHIVVAGIEKVIPTLEDVSVCLRLLGRSATGQVMSAYTSFYGGPRLEDDVDGPQAYHVVLVDNGRAKMLGNGFHQMLRCIRCGACLNHCPVYGALGGHAYGWVYPGPMGSVLTPQFVGLDAAFDLPNACTLNGRCHSVCPMQIPLPDLLRRLRCLGHRRKLDGKMARLGLAVWSRLAQRPALYHRLTQLGAVTLGAMGRRRGWIERLPGASGWLSQRHLPAPQGQSFFQQWKQRNHS